MVSMPPELRPPVPAAACPTRVLLDHVTSKWGFLVLVALGDGTMRWGALRRSIEGVSEKMLAQTLRVLEADGLVHREALPVVPPHVEYRLTDRGVEVVDLLLPLLGWLTEHAPELTGLVGEPTPSAGRP